eukprot:m.156110 g.156110  ORF g.156110 m.156110 type:complete len:161 (+) comp16979_c2_seq1:126-608(+)
MPPFCEFCGADGAIKFCGDCGRPQRGIAPRKDVDLEQLDRDFQQAQKDANAPKTLFKGTTWNWLCFSPLCCSSNYFDISTRGIDWESGCCRSHKDTMDWRRVKDIALRRNFFQMMIGRGTIIIFADDALSGNKISFTHQGAKAIHKRLRSHWTNTRLGVA